jgi:hypothetical protein
MKRVSKEKGREHSNGRKSAEGRMRKRGMKKTRKK